MSKQDFIKEYMESNSFMIGQELFEHIAENSYTDKEQSDAYIAGAMDCLTIFLQQQST